MDNPVRRQTRRGASKLVAFPRTTSRSLQYGFLRNRRWFSPSLRGGGEFEEMQGK